MTAVGLGSVAAVCLILFLSFSAARSYLHSTVHSPAAALACEAVHLSATMDMAQTGITSSFLETENVSLLWCVIHWNQHRENALFLPKPASVGYGPICVAHRYYSMGSWNVFVTGSAVFIVSPCFQIVCKGEPSLTNRFVSETLACVPCVGHRLSAIPATRMPDNVCIVLYYMNNSLIQLILSEDQLWL